MPLFITKRALFRTKRALLVLSKNLGGTRLLCSPPPGSYAPGKNRLRYFIFSYLRIGAKFMNIEIWISVTEGTFVCACASRNKRVVHESRDCRGNPNGTGGNFKVQFVNKLFQTYDIHIMPNFYLNKNYFYPWRNYLALKIGLKYGDDIG